MSALKRLASRTLVAAAVGVSVVGLAAGVSAYAAPAAPAARPAPCHIDWFTHPWNPGQYGATISIDTSRVFRNWLLTFGFTGSEQLAEIPAGPIDWWYQAGRVVAVKGDHRLRNLPVGQDVLQIPLIITGTPSGTPWFAVNGVACTVTATTAITPTTSTTTTTARTTVIDTTPTPRTTTTSTTSSSPPDSAGCTATYRILWQTATQFSAAVSWTASGTLYTSRSLAWTFSGDQQVTQLTPGTSAPTTWSQTGADVRVDGYDVNGPHDATFTATYSGVNGPPLRVGAGFSCKVSFEPAPATTTTTRTTSTTRSVPTDSCQATYQVIWQSATQFSARVAWSGTPTLYSSDQLRVVFSGDQHVTQLTPEQGPDATWTQTGNQLLVSGYPWAGGHAASFLATYSGVNGPPSFVGAVSGCTLTFVPPQTTTTTYASGS